MGRTPLDVDFTHYGTYDVRLVQDGYEPLLTVGKAKAPWWDNVGPDLVAEVIPAEVTAKVEWHYDLQPLNDDTEGLVDRARELRATAIEEPELGPE